MGEAAALISALTWAGTSIALGRLGGRYPAPLISSLRLLCATPFVVILLLTSDGTTELREAPRWVLLATAGSGIIGYGLGDTGYIRALQHVSIQRMAPTTTALWVAMTAYGGILLLDEAFSWGLILGGGLVVAGTWIIVAGSLASLPERRTGQWGTGRTVAAMMLVAIAWSSATLMLAFARTEVSASAAAAVRMPVGGLVIGALVAGTLRERLLATLPRGRDLALAAGVGMVGTGLGSWLFMYAVGEAGAGRAVILNSTSPLMALPLSMLILKERPTGRVAVGTVVCLAGTFAVLLT